MLYIFNDFSEICNLAKKAMDETTKKRVRAGRLLQNGKTPVELAIGVGIARQTAYT